MSYTIALAGKGGTGKTTVAGFLVRYLVDKAMTPVLAVDADSNSNLNEVLGLEVEETLGDAREEMKKNTDMPMTKDIFIQMKVQQAIVEAHGFDLIVMGRPEGPGCYCAANTLLTQFLEKLIDNYPYIVVDNEAGMEHISRLTTNNIDVLLVVSDPTRRGIQTAARIVELTESLGLNVKRTVLIVNQLREGQRNAVEQAVTSFDLELGGMVPADPDVEGFDLEGRATTELPLDNPALAASWKIFETIFPVR